MLHQTEEFLQKLQDVPVSIDEWLLQREVYRRRRDASLDPLDLGFATFYLNRTSRSGILGAGVIGGLRQAGRYKVGARYDKSMLRARIEKVADYRSRILVTHQDGVQRLRHWLPKGNVFAYIDPPYYAKGSSLYFSHFDAAQHQALANCLNVHAQDNWVLTYDRADPIREMYSSRTVFEYSLHYSANHRELARELMVISEPVAKAFDRESP
jgi:DNA adenine methylase